MAGPYNIGDLVGYGIRAQPTTAYSNTAGGLYGNTVTGLNLASKTTVLTLTGRWLVFHIGLGGSSTSNNLFISLNVDGVQICNDLSTNSASQSQPIYSANTTAPTLAAGPMPPLLVEQSLTLQLQKTGETGASLTFLAIPLGA